MKFRSAALAAVFLLASPLAHADDGWYLAFDYGQAKASQPVLFSAGSLYYNSGGSTYGGYMGPVSHDQTSSAHRFALGYWFNSYVGFEATRADLGEHVTHANVVSVPAPVSCGLPCENSYNDSPRMTADGKGLALTFGVPLPHGFKLVGRYGRFWSTVQYDSGITLTPGPYGNANPPPNAHQESSGVVSTYGLGASWEFAEHWAVRADWDSYKNLSGGSTTFDVRMVSAGIEYRF